MCLVEKGVGVTVSMQCVDLTYSWIRLEETSACYSCIGVSELRSCQHSYIASP